VDRDANTYWESAGNAFPQSITVDLGAAMSLARAVVKLPPSPAWGARSQTIAVSGSADCTSFTSIKAAASYTFDPASGNTATVAFTGTARYLRLTFSGNSGWPAAQASEIELWSS
jgi:hypothetical protein